MEEHDWIVVAGGGGCYFALRAPVNAHQVFVAPDGPFWRAWAAHPDHDARHEWRLDVSSEAAARTAAFAWAKQLD